MVDMVLPYNDWRSARYIRVYSETTTIPNTQGKVTSAQLAEGIMLDLWRDFCIRETGTGQQVAQLHDRYDDDDDDDDGDDNGSSICQLLSVSEK